MLARIPKRSTTILTNSRHRPWTADGFGTAFNKAKIAAGMADGDLHFHDLRGTAATKFYVAGLSERVIAEIMAWEEEHVAKIIRRYVGRTAATKAIIQQLNRKENVTCKTVCKTVRAETQLSVGAGEGNRTLVCSLGSCRSTIELRPQIAKSRNFRTDWPSQNSALIRQVEAAWYPQSHIAREN